MVFIGVRIGSTAEEKLIVETVLSTFHISLLSEPTYTSGQTLQRRAVSLLERFLRR